MSARANVSPWSIFAITLVLAVAISSPAIAQHSGGSHSGGSGGGHSSGGFHAGGGFRGSGGSHLRGSGGYRPSYGAPSVRGYYGGGHGFRDYRLSRGPGWGGRDWGGAWGRGGWWGGWWGGLAIGAFVPVLPWGYETVWWGGVPYYYADDTYFLWNRGVREYQVVSPPASIDQGAAQAPVGTDLFAYPKNGQATELQSRDRYECHHWAAEQSGFDPTRPGGGVAVEQSAPKRGDYLRAEVACLEARGYSVK